ncbi:MAG: zf-TFIIB domain-containing protein [Deltaproteobacteria bacterium]|nr:zf-TFIIB domain-containing protein [Deltaproteobacteria bacterium]
MKTGPIAGSEIYFCKGCGSVWLDDKEFSAMTKGRHGGPHGEG